MNELNLSDLMDHPVWEFALDEEGEEDQDETTVRPWEGSGTLDPSDGMFVVKAAFTLANGSKELGFLTPPIGSDSGLGVTQPVLITASGHQVLFWHGRFGPKPEELATTYRELGFKPEEIFPIECSSQVEFRGGPVAATVPGFLVLEDFRSGRTRVVT